jgi:site-specific DNA-methyltransferase (adenine-specific)
MIEHKILKVADLKPFPIREVRSETIEKLKERIKERGYNQAKSLTIVESEGEYIVADGNHRLKVLIEEGIEEVPCVIYSNEGDVYNLAVQANIDEDTYAPMDLFDWLDCVSKLLNEGYSQKEIGMKFGWSKDTTSDYCILKNKISAKVLDLLKQVQKGRAEKKSALADSTEGWFRTSGLYDLTPSYQEKLINAFISDKCNWNKSKVQSEAKKYLLWQEMIEIAGNSLVSGDDLNDLVEIIERNTYKSIEQLNVKVRDLNKKASNKLICGDALIELENLEDGSIDLVITDPPYGIEYSSNRSKYSDTVTHNKIENDGLDDALKLLKDVCEILSRKTKADSHLYFFTSYKTYSLFETIISTHFSIKNMIIWDKGNHGAGDLNGSWGNRHELIIFATKGNRAINIRKADIISVAKLTTEKMIHPTQKPVELIKKILEVSSQKADTVCDPFMGSGSTIKATKSFDGLSYIGIEIDKENFEKAKSYIGGC